MARIFSEVICGISLNFFFHSASLFFHVLYAVYHLIWWKCHRDIAKPKKWTLWFLWFLFFFLLPYTISFSLWRHQRHMAKLCCGSIIDFSTSLDRYCFLFISKQLRYPFVLFGGHASRNNIEELQRGENSCLQNEKTASIDGQLNLMVSGWQMVMCIASSTDSVLLL